MNKKLKLAVLCGGPSSEHEVSLKSGKTVFKSLDRKKYSADLIKINKNLEFKINKKKISLICLNSSQAILKKYDVLFLALHGEFGEDGKIQALLDIIGVPYTFSGFLPSALGMNKNQTNLLVEKHGIKIPQTIVISKNYSDKEIFSYAKRLGYPLVIKPNQAGSSVGVFIIKKQKELLPALNKTYQVDDSVLLQEFIPGRELTCGVLGNSQSKRLKPLPVVEIKSKREFFDYEAKYKDKNTQEICPAAVSSNLTKKVQEQAKLIHSLLGCDGLTRSDFIYNKSKGLFFLEINTIPGLTPVSLCPKEAKAAGYTYSEFLDKIIELALNKKYVKYRR